jgi:sec-independent protein translocase protein TatA
MSGPEIFVIIIVALLLFGAEKLPDIAKTIGKGMRDFKKATDDIRNEIESSTSDFRKDLTDVRDSIKTDVTSYTEKITKDMNDVSDSIKNDMNNVTSEARQGMQETASSINNDLSEIKENIYENPDKPKEPVKKETNDASYQGFYKEVND